MKPALLLDVDGVLNPYNLNYSHPNESDVPINGVPFHKFKLLRYNVWLSRTHGEWLNELSDIFELFWFTSWEHDANNLIGPNIGLPQLPVIKMPQFKNEWRSWKMPAIIEWAKQGRPFIWVDDDIDDDASQWAHGKDRILFHRVNANTGLTLYDVSVIREWGESWNI